MQGLLKKLRGVLRNLSDKTHLRLPCARLSPVQALRCSMLFGRVRWRIHAQKEMPKVPLSVLSLRKLPPRPAGFRETLAESDKLRRELKTMTAGWMTCADVWLMTWQLRLRRDSCRLR